MSAAHYSRQAGLSLVELMVAMLLSLLLMGGVLQIFLSSKQTYSTNEALSHVQENGRFAMSFLTYDIRNAAYKGECVSAISNLTGQTDERYTLDAGLLGRDSSQTAPTWFTSTRDANTDMILLKHASTATGLTLTSATTTTSLVTTQASAISQGTLLVVADPVSCDLFENRSTETASTLALPSTKTFPRIYPTNADVLRYRSVAYYVENGTLKRIDYGAPSPAAAELVSGVSNLQLKFATGDAVSGEINSDYLDAQSISDWSAVVSVQATISVVSPDANNPVPRTFTSTIGIRNRLP